MAVEIYITINTNTQNINFRLKFNLCALNTDSELIYLVGAFK